MTHPKKLIGLSTVLALAVFGAGTSLAATPNTAKAKFAQTRKTQFTIVQTVYGTVSAVTPGTKTVEVTLPWDKADRLIPGARVTEIKEGKTSKSLADLKTGEHVRMKFVEHVRSHHVAQPIIISLEQHRG